MTAGVTTSAMSVRQALHALAFALSLTAGFVLMTAPQLGLYGPLVIAGALYAIVFVAALEGGIALQRLGGFLATRRGRRSIAGATR